MSYDLTLAAERRIRPHIRETPLIRCPELSGLSGAEVYLKCEHLQHTGSFKFRGALNRVLTLDDDARGRGVIAASSGNHGMAVARAAGMAGVGARIYVPGDISAMKRRAIEALGAEIETVAGDALCAEVTARAAAGEEGRVFISPYNDAEVMAGQGTIGIELAAQAPGLDAVFAAVGGGGLIAGIAGYLSRDHAAIAITGCWPENAPAMYQCIRAGKIIDVPELPTLSDGTAGGIEEGAITLKPCRELVRDFVLVSEGEIADAMRLIARHHRFIIEGSAGVAVAGFIKAAGRYRGKTVAIILCGRNIGLEKFIAAIG